MTIEEAIASLNALQSNVGQIVLEVLLGQAASVNALVNNRVEQKGQDADGGFFSDYSQAYAKFREKQDRQTAHKDFSFTRQLWKSIGVTFKAAQGNKVVIVLEPQDQVNKDKLRYLEQQEGKAILEVSSDEALKIARVIDSIIANKINKL